MRPYFQNDAVTLYLGDCLEILPRLEVDSVDCIISDPPYGKDWQSNYRTVKFEKIAGDESQDVGYSALRVALPLLKNKKHLYYFGEWDLSEFPVGSQVALIWDKVNANGGDLEIPWANQHELIQFCVNVSKASGRARNEGGLSARLRKGSVLRYPRPQALRHPTEKPVPLLRELIESSTRFGEVVLDPFAGVGSTLVAAQLEGRRAVGIELSEAYCEIAARRLSQSVLPLEFEVAA